MEDCQALSLHNSLHTLCSHQPHEEEEEEGLGEEEEEEEDSGSGGGHDVTFNQ